MRAKLDGADDKIFLESHIWILQRKRNQWDILYCCLFCVFCSDKFKRDEHIIRTTREQEHLNRYYCAQCCLSQWTQFLVLRVNMPISLSCLLLTVTLYSYSLYFCVSQREWQTAVEGTKLCVYSSCTSNVISCCAQGHWHSGKTSRPLWQRLNSLQSSL